ncbi:MAG: GntR family transcriptional regulator [Acetatifactor sp.]
MKKSVSAQVHDSILNDIFSTRYKPGQILTERALIEEYGCSKTTVREALVALCQEHIVRSIPRFGYEVLRVERSEITDILEYRYVLETGCLNRCFEHITPRHILRLQELSNRCCDPDLADNLWTHWDHNAAFHLELIGLAGNRYASQQLKSAMDILKRAYAQYYWGRRDDGIMAGDMKNHALLLTALRQRDLTAACSAIGKDLKEFPY